MRAFYFTTFLTIVCAKSIVDPEVQALLDKDGTADILVRVTARSPDLSFDGTISHRERRVRVHAMLSQVAHESQHRLLATAHTMGVECKGYWIASVVTCRQANASFVRKLDSLGATRVRRLRGVRRVTGIPHTPDATQSGDLPADAGWNTRLVKAPEAWNSTRGEGVVIAIIDGGVKYDHPALVNGYRGTIKTGHGVDDDDDDAPAPAPAPSPGLFRRRRTAPSPTPSSDFDHDYSWYDPVYNSKSPSGSDTDGHGTHVTGIAAGGEGVGAAPGAKWIHAKACNYAGFCSDDWALQTAQWVMCPTPVGSSASDCSKGAQVVSCSWGEDTGGDDYMVNVTQAWEAAHMVGVFAVGNSGPDCATVASPSDYATSLGVGATDKDDALADFSSRGPSVGKAYSSLTKPGIVAPGVYVPSTWYTGGYYHLSGTSQACPLVAGTAALVLAANPSLTPAQVRQSIISSAEQSALSTPSGKASCGGKQWNQFPNDIYGNGRLDAAAAVSAGKRIAAAVL